MKVNLGQLRSASQLVLDHASLRIVSLQRAVFEVAAPDVDPPFDTNIVVQVSGDVTNASTLLTTANYQVNCYTGTPDPADRVDVWSVSLSIAAEWQISEIDLADIDQIAIRGFSLTTAAPLLHPYARETIQDLTARSAYPAYTIGLMESISNIPDTYEFDIADS